MLENTAKRFKKQFIVLTTGLGISFNVIAALDDNQLLGSSNIKIESIQPLLTASTNTATDESWNIHGQLTYVNQWHPSFNSPYRGTNSFDSGSRQAHTTDLTLFAGIRLWQGAEFYLNPEFDQGFGLSNTLGVAGFPSGEAYKVGKNYPYFRLPRAFLRQVINLEGSPQIIDSGANQLAGSRAENNIVLTAGKFAVVDIFDTNIYAHDPRGDFLNWSILDAGAFDYAADAWGFTYGLAAEWTQSRLTVRGGLFALSQIPNYTQIQGDFSQYSTIVELEERHQWLDHNGKVKLLIFDNRGRMAKYTDAVQLANQIASTPDPTLSRHFNSRTGIGINLEQEVTSDIGLFARASINDGSKETYEFSDINKSISGGLSIRGNSWGRPDDNVGIAGAINGISNAARQYFAAGGLGLLVGDGKLNNYSMEKIFEAYYSLQLNSHVQMSLDYQYINNPAYNQDRGPVSIAGLRLHAEL